MLLPGCDQPSCSVMDRSTVTVSALLLLTAVTVMGLSEADAGTSKAVTIQDDSLSPNTSTTTLCSCSNPTPTAPPTPKPCSPARKPGFLTVSWKRGGQCAGDVILRFNSTYNELVCSSSEVKTHLADVCQNKNDCEGEPTWVTFNTHQRGNLITDGGTEPADGCEMLSVKCKKKPNLKAQLNAYKVVTALLCLVLLLLLLIRFTRPAVKALQKRLSDRRQSRWIGPTQSHSVSYHRGKTTVKNDGEKRLSYPALERLAVSDSREPSSNRNSDFNF
ncbi:uncharacterized protein cd5 [Echeneis naucrates]|uniref:uncharacterized protein cd5 n=1 Tax=Echeneis naucrates TaxID=173247 RepID=UPI001113DEDC|nr:uncharacterized protein LOC115047496 [Echeneis naucrates]